MTHYQKVTSNLIQQHMMAKHYKDAQEANKLDKAVRELVNLEVKSDENVNAVIAKHEVELLD